MKMKNRIACIVGLAIFSLVSLIMGLRQARHVGQRAGRGINTVDRVVYINLDKRTDRKARLLKELEKVGTDPLRVMRSPAIYDPAGAVGCAKSHIAVLQRILEDRLGVALVLEDDFVWLDHDPEGINRWLKEIMLDPSWGLCVLACGGGTFYDENPTYTQHIRGCQTTSAYLIRSWYATKLLGLWKQKLPELQAANANERGALNIDQTWKILQSTDQFVASHPLLGTQGTSFSDIEEHIVSYYQRTQPRLAITKPKPLFAP
jgi:glycosyl transferase family 25